MVFMVAVAQKDLPVIQTSYGPVRGRPIEHDVGDATAFFGIPYARPPTGHLRFAAPEAPQSWAETRDAGNPGPSCYQSVETLKQLYPAAEVGVLAFDEDCLNLNVFIPGVGDVKDKDPLAVVVWFAGRTLDTAAPNLEPPYALSAHGNVIVVTVNYRVGVFGFFTTGSDDIAGNMALFDQQMALRWVQENIANFVGDKRRVTIAGEGVGAQSVSLHIISEMSRGLFSRAISFGSTMTQQYVPRPENVKSLSTGFTKSLGCHKNNMTEVVKCLRSKTSAEVNAVRAQFPIVVDGTFLTDDPYSLWNSTIANPVDYIIGCSSYSVGMEKARVMNVKTTGIPASDVKARIRVISVSEGYPPHTIHQGRHVDRAIMDQYLPDYTDPIENLRGHVMLEVDAACAAPAERIAAFLKNANRHTYLYEFGRVRAGDPLFRGLASLGPGWYALGHVDMVNPLLVQPEDAVLSRDVITMTSTFIRSGWVNKHGFTIYHYHGDPSIKYENI